MKIRVISEFYDKYHTSTLFKVGTVLDFDDERANDIISKKLAEPFEEQEKKRVGRPPKTAEPKPETTEAPKPEVADNKPAAEQQKAEEVNEEAKEEAKADEKPADNQPADDGKEKAE